MYLLEGVADIMEGVADEITVTALLQEQVAHLSFPDIMAVMP